MSRAKLFGTPTGKILENAYFIKTYSIDSYDLMRFLITNEGPNNSPGTWDYPNQVSAADKASYSSDTYGLKLAENVLFAQKTEFNYIGMAFASDCKTSVVVASKKACEYVFSVVVAQGYTNSANAGTCGTQSSFGGGACDPDAWTVKVFEAINDFRENAQAIYKPLLQNIVNSFKVEDTAYFDFNGSGTIQTRNFSSAKGNVIAAMNSLKQNNLGQLQWSVGLFMTAKAQAQEIKNTK